MLRLPLAHRHVGLAERPGQQRAVQQVAGPDPGPPLRHDVEREPRGVLVELPHQRLDAGRVEGRARQLVQRPDDADVRHVGRVPAAEDLRERADVAGADVPGPAGKRHHERYVLRAHPLGQQTHLGIAERERGHHPVPHHGGGGGHRPGHRRRGGNLSRPAPSRQAEPDRGARHRAQQDLLRSQAERPGRRARRRRHRHGPHAEEAVRHPPERRRQRAAHQDARPQRGDLPGTLPGPGQGLGRPHPGGPGNHPRGRRRLPATGGQCRPGQPAYRAGESDLLCPLSPLYPLLGLPLRRPDSPRSIHGHPRNLPLRRNKGGLPPS